MKRVIVLVVIFSVGVLLFAQQQWQGSAAVGNLSDFPTQGYYAASASFPLNSIITVRSLETGKVVRVVVTRTLKDSSIFLALSPDAARDLGLESGQVMQISAKQFFMYDVSEDPVLEDDVLALANTALNNPSPRPSASPVPSSASPAKDQSDVPVFSSAPLKSVDTNPSSPSLAQAGKSVERSSSKGLAASSAEASSSALESKAPEFVAADPSVEVERTELDPELAEINRSRPAPADKPDLASNEGSFVRSESPSPQPNPKESVLPLLENPETAQSLSEAPYAQDVLNPQAPTQKPLLASKDEAKAPGSKALRSPEPSPSPETSAKVQELALEKDAPKLSSLATAPLAKLAQISGSDANKTLEPNKDTEVLKPASGIKASVDTLKPVFSSTPILGNTERSYRGLSRGVDSLKAQKSPAPELAVAPSPSPSPQAPVLGNGPGKRPVQESTQNNTVNADTLKTGLVAGIPGKDKTLSVDLGDVSRAEVGPEPLQNPENASLNSSVPEPLVNLADQEKNPEGLSSLLDKQLASLRKLDPSRPLNSAPVSSDPEVLRNPLPPENQDLEISNLAVGKIPGKESPEAALKRSQAGSEGDLALSNLPESSVPGKESPEAALKRSQAGSEGDLALSNLPESSVPGKESPEAALKRSQAGSEGDLALSNLPESSAPGKESAEAGLKALDPDQIQLTLEKSDPRPPLGQPSESALAGVKPANEKELALGMPQANPKNIETADSGLASAQPGTKSDGTALAALDQPESPARPEATQGLNPPASGDTQDVALAKARLLESTKADPALQGVEAAGAKTQAELYRAGDPGLSQMDPSLSALQGTQAKVLDPNSVHTVLPESPEDSRNLAATQDQTVRLEPSVAQKPQQPQNLKDYEGKLDLEAWYLQLGAYSSEASIKALLAEYEDEYPFLVLSEKVRGKDLYKVYVGPISEDEKGLLLYTFRAKGFKDAFVKKGK